MKALRNALLALALAAWLAVPGVGGDGGENGGGTGVWVLPRASTLTSSTGSGAPIACESSPITQDKFFLLSSEVGVASATLVDTCSGLPVSLPVLGTVMRVPATLMQAIAHNPVPSATVVVADAANVGYVIKIVVDPLTGTAQFHAY
jgi:hypothetical protein